MRVAQQVIDAVVAHAREAAPDECCGILVGRHDDIVAAVRAHNIADAPASRFLIDPKDHFHARREARRIGVEVVGFYHSHPRTSATPSETDLGEAAYPDHFYLIVSLRGVAPDIQLFRLDRDNFRAVRFDSI